MTTASLPLAGAPARARSQVLVGTLGVVGLTAVAAVARLIGIRSANDVDIDEVTYTRLAMSIASGHGVALSGRPFDLHPPAALAAYALVDKLFLPGGTLLPTLLGLRFAAAFFGILACCGLYVLVRQGASRPIALGAGLLLAVDPFAIRFDTRVLLEAPTQAAAVGAIATLAVLVRVESPARRRRLVALAGLLSAIAVCSKETFGLALGLTLLGLLLTGWTHRRREIVVVIGITLAGYAVDVVALGLSTGFGPWWRAQTGGLARLLGTRQTTGFNAPTTHVSLVSRVVADAGLEASSYILLVLGTLAAVSIVYRGWRRRASTASAPPTERVAVLIGVWTLAGVAYLGYATFFGTIEEQMYYICLLPCVASLAVVVGPSVSGAVNRRRALAAMAAALVLFDLVSWSVIHTTPDTDYLQLVAWEKTHLAAGTVVATTEGTAQFLMSGVVIGQWSTVAQWRSHRVEDVVVSTTLADQGYGLARPELLRTLERRASLVFSADDRTTGHLEVYDVRRLDGVRQ